MESEGNYLTAKQLKELHGISRVTLWRWRNAGKVDFKERTEKGRNTIFYLVKNDNPQKQS